MAIPTLAEILNSVLLTWNSSPKILPSCSSMNRANSSACMSGTSFANWSAPVRAAREPCQRIVIGQVVDLLSLADVLERERDVARQLKEQLHLLIVEELYLACIQGKHSHPLACDDEGQHRQRVDAALQA